MIVPPDALLAAVAPWADFFAESQVAQALVLFAHIGGLVAAGGVAIAADRVTLRLTSDVDRRHHLLEMRGMHRTVIVLLAVVISSGVLMAAADLEVYWASPIYWVKMLLVGALLANGGLMKVYEARAGRDSVVAPARWSALRATARASMVLWMAVTFAGVALVTYA